jgi:2-oxoglutarate dehydrogenase E2 component (dihydrolipoamide succinyltransferase)
MKFPSLQAAAPPPASASSPPTPPSKPSAPAQTVPIAAIRHAQAIDAATVKLPPVDFTKEITGTRTEQRVKMNRMRLKIASRLKEAQNTNAMLTTFNEIDMSYIMEFRKLHQEAFLKKYGIKLGFMSAFCKAAAYALQDQPTLNAVIKENVRITIDFFGQNSKKIPKQKLKFPGNCLPRLHRHLRRRRFPERSCRACFAQR